MVFPQSMHLNYGTYVNPFMDSESSNSRIRFSAYGAHVGFVFGVCQVVTLQVSLGHKSFATSFLLAHKRPLSSLFMIYFFHFKDLREFLCVSLDCQIQQSIFRIPDKGMHILA